MTRWFYFLFAIGLAFACFRRPIPDEYDRYVYEAVARSHSASWGEVYAAVKDESPRLTGSPAFDNPEHLAEMGPMYAIRPLYLALIDLLHRAGLGYQRAISLISAASLFAIAILLWLWTRSALLSALTISAPAFVQLGRQGVPDGLNALCILAALYALIVHRRMALGLSLLLAAVWIRTDSILVCAAVLAWLAYGKKLELKPAAALLCIAGASVAVINHFSGNYGYAVLFRLSFIGGAHPLLVSSAHITTSEYLHGLASSLPSIVPQLAPWLLLAIAAWQLRSPLREWLIPIGGAALAHFLLFPSPESRYLNWALVFSAVAFISALVRVSGADIIRHYRVGAGG